MQAPIKNDKDIISKRSEYVKLYAPTTSWGNIISMTLGYPGLRGYWTMSSIDEDGNALDISGQGRTLSDY